MLLHRHLVCIIFDKNPAVLPYIMFVFSPTAFKILLFITSFKQFDYVIWYNFLHVSCVWGLLSFMDL